MKTTSAAITAMFILASACAMGEESTEFPEAPTFAALDLNSDLYIDKQEFEQYMDKMREEMNGRFGGGRRGGGKGPGGRRAQFYDDADADGDGLLNEYEFYSLIESMQEMRDKMRGRWTGKRQQG